MEYYPRNAPSRKVPLHRLQEKGIPFFWSEQYNVAFETLKRRLSSAPVLAFPQPSNMFVLDADASESGIGAQNQDGVEQVILYGTRTLTKSERNYCVTRKKLLALVYSAPICWSTNSL